MASLVSRYKARKAGQAVTVAAPSALTSAVAVGAPTKAEYDALRVDVNNLRTTVVNLRTALRDAGLVA